MILYLTYLRGLEITGLSEVKCLWFKRKRH
jgi:hypothetical protein